MREVKVLGEERQGEGGMTERARGESKMSDIFQNLIAVVAYIPLCLLFLLTTIADLCSVGGNFPGVIIVTLEAA